MKNKLFIYFTCLLLPSAGFSQIASPDVKCLSVASNGDVTLTWVTPPNTGTFVEYKIFASPITPAAFVLVGTVSTFTQTTFTHIGAGANTQRVYYLVQTEYNSPSGISAPADTFSTIHLVVTNQTNKAKLDWNAIANPNVSTSTGLYKIWREYPLTFWTLLDSTMALTYTDVIDICDDSLTYRIEIDDNTGCTSVSNVDGGKFLDQTPPTLAPIDTVSVNAAGLATISWNPSPSPDADSVIIYKSTPAWVAIATVPVPQTFYTYTASGADTVSEVFRIAFKDSCSPGNLSPQGIEHRTIYLSAQFDICAATANLVWNKYINMSPSPANQYQIFKSVNGTLPFTLLATQTSADTTYADTGLALGNSYCYFIRATNGTKTSTSNKQCFIANVLQPPTFTYNRYATVLPDNKSITITAHVDPAPGVYYYLLQRATGTSGSFSTIKLLPKPVGNALTYTDSPVSATVNSYSYRWQAMDSCAHVIMNSNLGTTMLLTASISANLDVTLSWNDYSDWMGTTDHYDIYRAVDGIWDPAPIGTYAFTGSGGTYMDDVSVFMNSKGIFSYKVVSHEGSGNTFGFADSSVSNTAKVFEYPKIYVPNAFTPNGDGKNDVFIPVIGFIEPGEYSFKIFDNTGTPVMWTDIPSEGWDGKKKGHDCQEGVYMYLIKCKASNGDDSQISGTVSLFR